MKNRRIAKSPLAFWLDANGMTMREFGRRIGISHSRLSGVVDGRAIPGIIVAYEVERLTRGEVPIESWLGIDLAKGAMAALRSGQPEEFQAEAFKKREDHGEHGGPEAPDDEAADRD